jgi:CRISPR-associated protein Csm5
MNYRITCLTPVLAGDGSRLAPIDYMIWKDQVNVLDQNRIFKMLAKGPRLDSYLAQIRKADRLKFAEWGGYAQNYAARRIPLEHSSIASLWERSRLDAIHIPSFASGPGGPFLPASALKGALRTALVWSRWRERGEGSVVEQAAAKVTGDRVPRRLAQEFDKTEPKIELADGGLREGALKIYYLRVARLQGALTWKESLPSFAEMAAPQTTFEGRVTATDPQRLLAAANQWSQALLETGLEYARQAKLAALAASLEGLRFKTATLPAKSCLLPLGWGAGFLTKAGASDTSAEPYRRILRALPLYSRAIQTGLPFPKTRRVVHINEQPAAFPGWVLFELRD